jgi:hypothetical protein
VAREGDVNKGVAAQLMGGTNDQIAAGNKVIVADQIGRAADFGKIFVSFACNTQDVRPFFLNSAESFRRAGNRLVNDDGLHLRIVGKVDNRLNGGF